jgi:hypothetical protein
VHAETATDHQTKRMADVVLSGMPPWVLHRRGASTGIVTAYNVIFRRGESEIASTADTQSGVNVECLLGSNLTRRISAFEPISDCQCRSRSDSRFADPFLPVADGRFVTSKPHRIREITKWNGLTTCHRSPELSAQHAETTRAHSIGWVANIHARIKATEDSEELPD